MINVDQMIANTELELDGETGTLTAVDLVVTPQIDRYLLTLEGAEVRHPTNEGNSIEQDVKALWTGTETVTHMQTYDDGSGTLTLWLILDSSELVVVTRQTDSVLTSVSRLDVLASTTFTGSVTHIDGSVDSAGNYFAIVASSSGSGSAELTSVAMVDQGDGTFSFESQSYQLSGSEIGDIVVEDNILAVS